MMAKKKQIPKTDWRIVVSGIAALTILECAAMAYGHNGTMLRVISAIIAVAIGVVIPTPQLK